MRYGGDANRYGGGANAFKVAITPRVVVPFELEYAPPEHTPARAGMPHVPILAEDTSTSVAHSLAGILQYISELLATAGCAY